MVARWRFGLLAWLQVHPSQVDEWIDSLWFIAVIRCPSAGNGQGGRYLPDVSECSRAAICQGGGLGESGVSRRDSEAPRPFLLTP